MGASSDGGAGTRSSRRMDLASLAGLIPVVLLLPVGVVCFLPVALLLGAVTRLPPVVMVVLWLAAAGLLFVPSVERFLLHRMFDARTPTPEEQEVLDRCWSVVRSRAGIPAERYLLAVQETEELNAAATGGHIVIVTTGAIEALPDDELRGVLAHELGHHLGLHAVGLLLAQWLSLPIVWCSRVSYRMSRIAGWFTQVTNALGFPVATMVGRLIALEFYLIALVLHVFTLIANALGRLIGHQAEYHADHAAAELGFGAELAGSLRRLRDLGMDHAAGATAVQRLFSTHPPLAARIQRLRSYSPEPDSALPSGGREPEVTAASPAAPVEISRAPRTPARRPRTGVAVALVGVALFGVVSFAASTLGREAGPVYDTGGQASPPSPTAPTGGSGAATAPGRADGTGQSADASATTVPAGSATTVRADSDSAAGAGAPVVSVAGPQGGPATTVADPQPDPVTTVVDPGGPPTTASAEADPSEPVAPVEPVEVFIHPTNWAPSSVWDRLGPFREENPAIAEAGATHTHAYGADTGSFTYAFALPEFAASGATVTARLSSEAPFYAAPLDAFSDVTLVVNGSASPPVRVIPDNGSGADYTWELTPSPFATGHNTLQFVIAPTAAYRNGLCIYADAVVPGAQDAPITVTLWP